jgi:hypothetical protein
MLSLWTSSPTRFEQALKSYSTGALFYNVFVLVMAARLRFVVFGRAFPPKVLCLSPGQYVVSHA